MNGISFQRPVNAFIPNYVSSISLNADYSKNHSVDFTFNNDLDTSGFVFLSANKPFTNVNIYVGELRPICRNAYLSGVVIIPVNTIIKNKYNGGPVKITVHSFDHTFEEGDFFAVFFPFGDEII